MPMLPSAWDNAALNSQAMAAGDGNGACAFAIVGPGPFLVRRGPDRLWRDRIAFGHHGGDADGAAVAHQVPHHRTVSSSNQRERSDLPIRIWVTFLVRA